MSGATADAPARPDVVGPIEVAKILNVAPQTVRNWIKSGQLPPPFRRGKIVRWRRVVIDQLLAGQADA